uniref:Methyltransferase FkbM domain-containing protein n=1 Tax=Meloidogyne javanica TaxID=6303 RepID=A0A915LUH5_MELJA
MIRNNKTNITDYDATIKYMPVHFNNIWGEHYNDLKPVGLQADSAEKKYFLKFRNSTSNTECNVVTLGVGQTVEAELELKQIYPQCKFLALDPVSEVNEDLVESKLNGTFVKKVITAEDSYTAYAGPVSIWNSEEQYDQLPVIICQINIEFHHVHYNANSFLRNRFFRNFNSFIRNDRFVVMKSDVHDVNYYPVFFVNYADKVCIEKFLC